MVKIYHRPDPPPPDVDSNRAVRRTDTFLNREASAGLFQKALVKAQGQEQAVERSKLADAGQQHQIESDSDSVLGAKTGDTQRGLNSEKNAATMSPDPHALESADLANEAAEIAEFQETSDDVNSAEQDEQDADSALSSAESSTGLDSSAAYQMFDNIRDLNSSPNPEPHNNTSTTSETSDSKQDATVSAQAAVAHSGASTAVSVESRVDSIARMSDLIDMLETSSQLPEGNDWTLLLDDDGPVSELKLSSDADGRWNIDLLTSFDNESVDDDLFNNLRHQLDNAGVAVANIALVEPAPVESTSAQQPSAADSATNNIA